MKLHLTPEQMKEARRLEALADAAAARGDFMTAAEIRRELIVYLLACSETSVGDA